MNIYFYCFSIFARFEFSETIFNLKIQSYTIWKYYVTYLKIEQLSKKHLSGKGATLVPCRQNILNLHHFWGSKLLFAKEIKKKTSKKCHLMETENVVLSLNTKENNLMIKCSSFYIPKLGTNHIHIIFSILYNLDNM